jgi:hypothetical protein
MNSNGQETAGDGIHVPASTGWPLVAAFGLTLVFAGLLTHVMVSTLGLIALCMGLVGWFRQVLPCEVHEAMALEREGAALPSRELRVRHLEIGELGHRARLPLEIYRYSAGVRGGLVGGAAMAILAILYGTVGHGSIWYPLVWRRSADVSTPPDIAGWNSRAVILVGHLIHRAGNHSPIVAGEN